MFNQPKEYIVLLFPAQPSQMCYRSDAFLVHILVQLSFTKNLRILCPTRLDWDCTFGIQGEKNLLTHIQNETQIVAFDMESHSSQPWIKKKNLFRISSTFNRSVVRCALSKVGFLSLGLCGSIALVVKSTQSLTTAQCMQASVFHQ